MENECVGGKGRRLLVEFTCGRCLKVAYSQYSGNPACNEKTNMLNVAPPEGWRDADGYMPLLCPKCAEEHDKFMRTSNGGTL